VTIRLLLLPDSWCWRRLSSSLRLDMMSNCIFFCVSYGSAATSRPCS
jgi:hypothetical protein